MTGERFEVVLSSTEEPVLGGQPAGKDALLGAREAVSARWWTWKTPGSFSQWTDLPGKAVRIYNQFGSLVWWGYVQGASREEGSYALALAGSLAQPRGSPLHGTGAAGRKFGSPQTNWAEDEASVLAFGKKNCCWSAA